MNHLRLAAVSYLNTKPLLFGLQNHPQNEKFEINTAPPAICAEMLANDEVDIGLIPVASSLDYPEYAYISDYGIASYGPVHSVLIVSNDSIGKCQKLWLDPESRTSNQLAILLLREFWKVSMGIDRPTSRVLRLKEKEATVIIGDAAFAAHQNYRYVYDLSECWRQLTSLPFVFARWIAKGFNSEWHDILNKAFQIGLEKIETVIDSSQSLYAEDVKTYLTKNIQYSLGEAHDRGLSLFLEQISAEVI